MTNIYKIEEIKKAPSYSLGANGELINENDKDYADLYTVRELSAQEVRELTIKKLSLLLGINYVPYSTK